MKTNLLDKNIDESPELVKKWKPTSLLNVDGWNSEKKKEVSLGLEKTYQYLLSISSFYNESEKLSSVLLPSITRIAKHDVDVSGPDLDKLVEIADENIGLEDEELAKKIESEYLKYIKNQS